MTNSNKKSTEKQAEYSKLWFFPLIFMGLFILVIAARNRPAPKQKAVSAKPPLLRYLPAVAENITPIIKAHGLVSSYHSWTAIAEVGGKIVEFNPLLKNGAVLSQNTTVLTIDPFDYQLLIAQAKAGIEIIIAKQEQLNISQQNLKKSIKLEQQSLMLAKTELERQKKLLNTSTSAQATVDRESRNVLMQAQKLQSLQNQLALIPASHKELQAQLQNAEAKLAEAWRKQEKTKIVLPYQAKISQLAVDKEQFVNPGQFLFRADDANKMEITCQVKLSKLKLLYPHINDSKHELEAIIEYSNQYSLMRWHGKAKRLGSSVDPLTGTAKIMVVCDLAHQNNHPLLSGMHVNVILKGQAQHKATIIPRNALKENQVMIINPQNQLELRRIKIDFNQGEKSIIASGIKVGEKIVISDTGTIKPGAIVQPVLGGGLK